MSPFTTPEPISVRLEARAGSVHLVASERLDTVVGVRPHDEASPADVWSAEHLRVDFRDGRLTISGPRRAASRHRGGAVDLDVALPPRSRLHATLRSADLRAEGEYTDVRLATGSGDVEIEAVTGRLKAVNASGTIAVRAVDGYASVATTSGPVRVHNLDGELKFKAASGSLSVDTLRGHLRSRTGSGSVIVESGVEGAVSVHTNSGEVALGVPTGTAVRFDIVTGSGAVTNRLRAAEGPEADDKP
ncbi:DUF4097 family beta strand repeat-containing protein [Mycobacterium sp. ML4]